MAKDNNFPEWFVWTTSFGLVIAIFLLWLNYDATINLNRNMYGMMQTNSNSNLAGAGMMRMMAGSMMKNNLMTSGDFANFDRLYQNQLTSNQNMQKMMQDGRFDSEEITGVRTDYSNMRDMMNNMMR
ncbi:MAG: hypothetical protein AABX38_04090 [Candidatus Micrarchaeota archaeon]